MRGMTTLRHGAPGTHFGHWLACRGLVLPFFAAGGAAALSMLFSGSIDATLALVTALVVHASYLIDAASEDGDATTASARTLCLQRRRHRALGGGLVAFAAALVLSAAAAGPAAACALLLFPLAVALYVLPWLRLLCGARAPVACIKDIPCVKAFYTAFFWGLLGAFAVVWLGRGDSMPALVGGFAIFFLRLLLNTLFCDLKDLDRDRAAGVRTWAAALGRDRLLDTLALLNLLLPLLLLALVAAGVWPPTAMALALSTLYFQALLDAARRDDADLEFLCNVVADAEWAPWPLYLAAGSLLLG